MASEGLAFIPCSTVEGACKTKSIIFLAPQGPLSAELLVGAVGFILKVKDPTAGKTVDLHAVMVPSASIDLRHLSRGTITVAGAWPASSISIQLSSVPEATQLKECLQAIALNVAQSLHQQAPPGAPSLALHATDANQMQRQPKDCGPFLLAGYVIHNVTEEVEMDVADVQGMANGSSSDQPPCFRLYWTELCGPNEYGLLAFHFYWSHHPDALLVSLMPLPRSTDAYARVGSILKVQCEALEGRAPTYECLTFRTEDEAKAWIDLAEAAHNRQELRKKPLEAVRSGLEQRGERPVALRVFTDITDTEDPTAEALPPSPTDELVVFWQERMKFQRDVADVCQQCGKDTQILNNMSASDSVVIS